MRVGRGPLSARVVVKLGAAAARAGSNIAQRIAFDVSVCECQRSHFFIYQFDRYYTIRMILHASAIPAMLDFRSNALETLQTKKREIFE